MQLHLTTDRCTVVKTPPPVRATAPELKFSIAFHYEMIHAAT